MGDSFDKFVEDLQEGIIQDARAYYSDKVVDLWLNPLNLGVLHNPQGYAQVKGPCGDTIEVFLHIEENRITRATFTTDGCGPSVAAGSMATQLAVGKTLDEARAITPYTILEALGGLPEESEHCALLAANTLASAIANSQREKVPHGSTSDTVKNPPPGETTPAEKKGAS